MTDFTTEAGNKQDKPETSCSVKKKVLGAERMKMMRVWG